MNHRATTPQMDPEDPRGTWRLAARCLDGTIEMVPGSEGDHLSFGEDVQLAKKVCATCPVRSFCLDDADRNAGVWGGLTLDERERLRLGRLPWQLKEFGPREIVTCTVCDLPCVPPLRHIPQCDTCLPADARRKDVEYFKADIVKMIEQGYTYVLVAERYGLRREGVRRACVRWGVRSKAGKGPEVNPIDRAPCGTPAARQRHRRDAARLAKQGKRPEVLSCACVRPESSEPAKNGKGQQ